MLEEQWKWQHVHYMRAQRILHAYAVHTKQIKPIFYWRQIADTIYRLGHDIGRYMSADRYIGRALLVVMRSFFFSMLFQPLLCIWLLSLRPTNGGRRRVVGVPCFVQGSKWPPTSGIILCQ